MGFLFTDGKVRASTRGPFFYRAEKQATRNGIFLSDGTLGADERRQTCSFPWLAFSAKEKHTLTDRGDARHNKGAARAHRQGVYGPRKPAHKAPKRGCTIGSVGYTTGIGLSGSFTFFNCKIPSCCNTKTVAPYQGSGR